MEDNAKKSIQKSVEQIAWQNSTFKLEKPTE